MTFGGKTGGWGTLSPPAGRPINFYFDISDDTSPNTAIFKCSDDTIPRYGDTRFDTYGTSYYMNNMLLGLNRPHNLSEVKAPLDSIFLEADDYWMMPGHGGNGFDDIPRIPVMVLFVDGHVKGPFFFGADFGDTDAKVLTDPGF
jgi:prepilin-type processing-associated H-X9-DG protein